MIQIILCNLLVIFAGLCAIYYVECRINIGSCDMAAIAAEDLAQSRTLRNPEQYLTYSVFYRSEQGVETLHSYYGQRKISFEQYIDKFSKYYEIQKPFYALQGSLYPIEMVSLAGQPVFRDNKFMGFVYVSRSLDYSPILCIVYVLLSTILYYLIVVSIMIQKKSRDRVEQIYHRYIANISHELKSPIASIQAITETLNEGFVEDESTRSRYYGIISRESRLLEHSVLQIIELSKLQDQRQSFTKTKVSTHEVFDPIYERFSSRCEDIGITFEIDESIWALPPLYTDPFRLTQLIEILLDNAFKFVDEDGKIFINATSKYGQATLRVNDDGRGISKEDFPHIFERFYKSTVNNPTGSGLGLAIAKEIVNGLDEQIWVQSKENEGTIFFVTVSTQ